MKPFYWKDKAEFICPVCAVLTTPKENGKTPLIKCHCEKCGTNYMVDFVKNVFFVVR